MSNNDEDRRLTMFKQKPSASGKSDEYLRQEIANAVSLFLDYTNRSFDPGPSIDSIIVDIATISVNMAGAEGSTSASEGGISRTWSSIPPELQIRMNRWRRPIGHDAVTEQ